MRFFEPSNDFISWLTSYANGRIIVDVGCGDGHVTKALLENKAKAVGIEPFADVEQNVKNGLVNCILPMEAQRCRFLRQENIVAIFCRPCHSGFVEEAIDLLHPTSEALYISKPWNVKVDVGSFEVEELIDAPACNIESVYRIKKRIRPSPVSRRSIDDDFDRAFAVINSMRMQLRS